MNKLSGGRRELNAAEFYVLRVRLFQYIWVTKISNNIKGQYVQMQGYNTRLSEAHFPQLLHKQGAKMPAICTCALK